MFRVRSTEVHIVLHIVIHIVIRLTFPRTSCVERRGSRRVGGRCACRSVSRGAEDARSPRACRCRVPAGAAAVACSSLKFTLKLSPLCAVRTRWPAQRRVSTIEIQAGALPPGMRGEHTPARAHNGFVRSVFERKLTDGRSGLTSHRFSRPRARAARALYGTTGVGRSPERRAL